MVKLPGNCTPNRNEMYRVIRKFSMCITHHPRGLRNVKWFYGVGKIYHLNIWKVTQYKSFGSGNVRVTKAEVGSKRDDFSHVPKTYRLLKSVYFVTKLSEYTIFAVSGLLMF
jgi:hypothetical protein